MAELRYFRRNPNPLATPPRAARMNDLFTHTSREAHAFIEPLKPGLRQRVLDFIDERGKWGATDNTEAEA